MNIFLYALIFITGTFFGSFFTLAVYRIPKKEDILIKHSYCPNCNHKLGFFDLFPVFSYLFLRGKCRYCGDKIRPRYLILEVLTGLAFLLVAFSMKFNIDDINNMLNVCATLIYISVLFIIIGIDKEKISIPKNVIAFGYLFEIIYIIYQCTLQNSNVYQYVIYLILLIIILILSNITLKLTAQEKYFIQILYLSLYMIIFGGSNIFVLTVILGLIMISVYPIIFKKEKKGIPMGCCLSISNILIILISNYVINYII